MDRLSFERIWEDDGFFEIKVTAQSEIISAATASYTDNERIGKLSSRLKSFPLSDDDSFFWENGEKGDWSAACFSLLFTCKDKLGHIRIEVYMELDDGGAYSKHNCCFYIYTEPGALNEFGRDLARLLTPGCGQKAELNLQE